MSSSGVSHLATTVSTKPGAMATAATRVCDCWSDMLTVSRSRSNRVCHHPRAFTYTTSTSTLILLTQCSPR